MPAQRRHRRWELDSISLRTVGIDIGSATSHLVFSRVRMDRQAQGLSSRFTVTSREVLWRSPVILTPYLREGAIDASALARFARECYRSAGIQPGDVDSGAVILTGTALQRRNAKAIADLLAGRSGKFVCASAGHHLEATLAAHGSGSVALSRRTGKTVLHLDAGGGTTKAAVISKGEVLDTAAIAAGGRLLVLDGGVASQVEEPMTIIAEHLGVALARGGPVPEQVVTEVARALAAAVGELAQGAVKSALARALLVTGPLSIPVQPDVITVSGGVAEYLFGYQDRYFGDIGPAFARALGQRLEQDFGGLPVVGSPHRMRATVIGASQFSVQVSGNTVDVPTAVPLPRSNLPVLHPRIDLSGTIAPSDVRDAVADAVRRMHAGADSRSEVALAFTWQGDPSYPRLRALAEGILAGRSLAGIGGHPLVLLLAGDVACSIGRLLREELKVTVPTIVLDGLELSEFDYADIGQMIRPAGVVPVIIKSLLFGPGGPAEARR